MDLSSHGGKKGGNEGGRENSTIDLFPLNRNTHCASQSDIMKAAPVVLVTVHYHLPVVLLRPPLSGQVQQHFLSQGVHPHGGEEGVQRRCDFHAAHLHTYWDTLSWKLGNVRSLNVGVRQGGTYFLSILCKKHRHLSVVRVWGYSAADFITSAALRPKLLPNSVSIIQPVEEQAVSTSPAGYVTSSTMNRNPSRSSSFCYQASN